MRSALLCCCLLACSEAEPPNGVAAAASAVVSSRCSPCHRDGGIEKPLVDGLGPWMLQRVLDRTMPPGQPSADTPRLRDDPRLSDNEVVAMKAWGDAGFPPLASVTPTQSISCDAPLLINAYTPPSPVPGGGEDQYRCFLLPTDGLGEKTIRSFSWLVGQPSQMHHVVAVVVGADGVTKYANLPNGWECPQSLEVAAVASLGSGGTHELGRKDFGPDAGIPIPPGGGIIVQMHYLLGRGLPDRSGLCLDLVDSTPLHVVDVVVSAPAELPPPLGVSVDATSPLSRDYAQHLPFTGWTPDQVRALDDGLLAGCGYTLSSYYAAQLGDGRVTSRCRRRVGVTGEVRNVHLHMHTYGVGGRVKLIRTDGTESLLLDYSTPKYLWSWETIWGLGDGVSVAADDEVEVTCEWDNSPENQWSRQYGPSLTGQRVVDPVEATYVPGLGVRAGEMCDGTVSVAVQ